MTDPVHWITDPLQYQFMQRALVEVLVTGVVTGVIGAYIVLRGLSFIGDALSHAIFPGIVIACALADRPGTKVHLVESNQKKVAFLRDAVRVTESPGLVHAVRIEAFTQTFAEHPDAVTARALAPLDALLALSYPLLKKGAKGLFPKGQDVEAELTQAAKCWNIEASLVPSKTNPEGRIVML